MYYYRFLLPFSKLDLHTYYRSTYNVVHAHPSPRGVPRIAGRTAVWRKGSTLTLTALDTEWPAGWHQQTWRLPWTKVRIKTLCKFKELKLIALFMLWRLQQKIYYRTIYLRHAELHRNSNTLSRYKNSQANWHIYNCPRLKAGLPFFSEVVMSFWLSMTTHRPLWDINK